MNQYIYFSSKGNYSESDTADSDFSVNFSNPIVIPPYAEIRCVNCRVNPNNNTYAVKEGQNDRLAFGVGKFWILEQDSVSDDVYNNALPLFSVKLDPGIYDLSSGTDPEFYLNAQIEHQINEQITNIPNLRGGVSVAIDSSKVLTIKVSPMGGNGFYDIPDGENLPADLLDKFKKINSRTTSLGGGYFESLAVSDRVELAPFNMNANAIADADMKPPNQLGAYDVTTDTLVGVFTVGMIVAIKDNADIYARVDAVAANKPTKLTLYSPSDLWKTNVNPCNVEIQNIADAGITCRITQFTTTGPDWRGVDLYSSVVSADDVHVAQRCGYFMSPPINWNSMGDWATSDEEQYKLVSTFTINLDKYSAVVGEKTTYRGVYSCFTDSLVGMDCGAPTAGLGAGCFSGAVIPYSYLNNADDPHSYFAPEDIGGGAGDDNTTEVEDLDELRPYLFRAQFEFEDGDGSLRLYLKNKEGAITEWGDLAGGEIGAINLTAEKTYLSIETYVKPRIDTNAMLMQVVVKTKVDTGDWTTQLSINEKYPNYFGFHQLCSEEALDSKVDKPANLRFSYCHNAPNSKDAVQTDKNFVQPGAIYWAGAYNPIDGANGFVNGEFRDADYITSQATNLPSNLPVLLFGDDSIGATDKLVISQDNPNDGTVVDWTGLGDARLRDTGANAGIVLGLDEQGWATLKANSFSTGIVFDGNVNANERDFPMHFLDLPDLALNNHTGTCNGTGRPNKFVCPLDLNSGAGQNNIHSSQNETLIYNDLGNAMEERITNMRIRICSLDGTPSINLQNYTVGCLEIRENPAMKQAKMQRALEADKQSLEYQSGVRPSRFNRVQ